MLSLTRILESPVVYSLWQAPFAEDKFAPLQAHNDLRAVRRVLDVGCGPGTNARHFQGCKYIGIDVNPDYISYANRHYAGEFIVADATQFNFSTETFDFILLNSFLHHVDTESVRRTLSHLSRVLDSDGYMHILELILPEHNPVPRFMARMDRGRFARSMDQWSELFSSSLEIITCEPFQLRAFGFALWQMVYCKGRAKT